jgi:hypothetical protein
MWSATRAVSGSFRSPSHDVALGDDPRSRLVRVHDDGGTDAPLGHQNGRLTERVPRSDDEDDPAHSLTNLHRSAAPIAFECGPTS